MKEPGANEELLSLIIVSNRIQEQRQICKQHVTSEVRKQDSNQRNKSAELFEKEQLASKHGYNNNCEFQLKSVRL